MNYIPMTEPRDILALFELDQEAEDALEMSDDYLGENSQFPRDRDFTEKK